MAILHTSTGKHHRIPSVTRGRKLDRLMPLVLLVASMVPILTTFGIVITLAADAWRFFAVVPLSEVFSTELAPLRAEPSFGILPLVNGTVLTSLIAMLVAIPVGLGTALYLSEFTSNRVRKIIKPIIEVIAGVPTIVYGYFAYSFVTPLLIKLLPGLGAKNVLSPGLVMGVMIIPIVASLSEDAMNAVQGSLREGAYALGSTRFEVAGKVVMPAAMSGIIASFVLGISRAVGETMIVSIASGSSKRFSFDITQSMQTMTGYIVEFTSGDAASGTTGYYSLYAVGLLLFIFTLILNLVSQAITRRFRLRAG
ncbi:MAG: phosphate ABC transporter permease subunit PstC [Clostridiaceae bacterium]|jgi:phosphate transport system permease protein|nr:phosphate ABC transporter permease subunit PstC [Clostridiaceae bacterium]